MSDNTVLNSGSGGDTVRTVDRTTAKTQVVQLDWGGDTGAGNEQLATGANPFPIAINAANFIFSTGNTSSVQLAVGATFGGAVESVLNQPSLSVLMVADQPILLTLYEYIDAGGTQVAATRSQVIPASTGFSYSIPINGNYLKMTAQNVGTATTTTFTLNTAYGTISSADMAGNMPSCEYGSQDYVGVPIFEAALRGDLALNAQIINQPKTDPNNFLMSSDCPAPVRLNSTTVGQTFIIDTLGYPSCSITMGTMAATLTGSNDPAQTAAWSSVEAISPAGVSLTASPAAATSYVIPCVFRYLKLVVTTVGWATYYLRNIQSGMQLLSQMPCNLTDIGSAAVSSTTAQLGMNIVNIGGTPNAAQGGFVAIGASAATNGQTLGTQITPTTPAALSIKSGAGKLFFLSVGNPNTAAVYLKLFNQTSVTLGTTSATLSYMIPASATLNIDINDTGLYFSTGIMAAVTNLASLTDNTAITTGCSLNYAYI